MKKKGGKTAKKHIKQKPPSYLYSFFSVCFSVYFSKLHCTVEMQITLNIYMAQCCLVFSP